MSLEATSSLCRFESLVKTGEIVSFSVSILESKLIIMSDDGTREQIIVLDDDTFSSLSAFFHEMRTIIYGSFDYTNLKSMINTKEIIDRMLHNSRDSK